MISGFEHILGIIMEKIDFEKHFSIISPRLCFFTWIRAEIRMKYALATRIEILYRRIYDRMILRRIRIVCFPRVTKSKFALVFPAESFPFQAHSVACKEQVESIKSTAKEQLHAVSAGQ